MTGNLISDVVHQIHMAYAFRLKINLVDQTI
jgi:hypothetical protein